MINFIYYKSSILVLTMLFGIFLIIGPGSVAGEPSAEESLAWCEALAIEASEMAFKAQATLDYPLTNRALSSAEEAVYLVSQVSKLAQNSSDQRLAFFAYRVSNQVKAAIGNIVQAARQIASKSPDPEVVHAANFLLESCEMAQKVNGDSMETALVSIRGGLKSAKAYTDK